MYSFKKVIKFFLTNPDRKIYEKEFLGHLNAQARVLQRPLGFLAIFVWLSYIIDTDPKLHPEFPELFYFRISFVISGIIVFFVSFIDRLRGKGLGWLYVIAVFLLLTCAFFTGRLADDPSYVAGLQLVIVVGALMPFPFKAFLVLYTLSLALFISAIQIYQPDITAESFKYSMNNLAIGYIMAYLMTLLLDKFRFMIFINHLKLKRARDQLWGEMQIAKKIQTVLLPKKPSIEGYEISVHMAPTDEVGGDYYDIINVQGVDWVVIGDVSGHGVSAGLIMMMVQTSLNVAIDQNPDLDPSELLTVVNRTISKNIRKLNEDKYMSITVLSCHDRGKFYFSGLHQDLMIYRNKSKSVEIVETDGIWIGIVDEISEFLDNKSIVVETDDTVLLYTDGLTESLKEGTFEDHPDSGIEMFGDEKLKDLFSSLAQCSTEEIKNGILEELERYTCNDDMTIVILKRTE